MRTILTLALAILAVPSFAKAMFRLSWVAALVLLRRELLRRGRDLRLVGMRDRTRQVYAVNRLDAVLPEQGEVVEAEPIRLRHRILPAAGPLCAAPPRALSSGRDLHVGERA